MRTIILLAGLAAAIPAARPPVPRPGPDWILVLPDASFREACEPLIQHRSAQGYAIKVPELAVRQDGSAEGLRAWLRGMHIKWDHARPPHIVLLGDVPGPGRPGIPTFQRPHSDPPGSACATDLPYADLRGDDGLPDAALGRISARTPEEARAIVQKILRYETAAPPGAWRRRIAVTAGQGGFGPLADALLEEIFAHVLKRELPLRYDADVCYANPSSPYCYPPARLGAHNLERLRAGALLHAYVGHGLADRFDHWQHAGGRGEILPTAALADIDLETRTPIFAAFACLTAAFDDPARECVGEVLLRNPRGPAAFLGATRISQPYANQVLSLELMRLLTARPEATLGELWLAATRASAAEAPEGDATRRMIDNLAQAMWDRDTRRAQRLENVEIYELLGDPAFRLPRARALDWPGLADTIFAGVERLSLTLDVPAPDGTRAVATLEHFRGHLPPDLDAAVPPTDDDAWAQRYRRALDVVVARGESRVAGGRLKVDLPLSADLERKRYLLKLLLEDGRETWEGCLTVKIDRTRRRVWR